MSHKGNTRPACYTLSPVTLEQADRLQLKLGGKKSHIVARAIDLLHDVEIVQKAVVPSSFKPPRHRPVLPPPSYQPTPDNCQSFDVAFEREQDYAQMVLKAHDNYMKLVAERALWQQAKTRLAGRGIYPA